jgi:hypothetical protein
MAAETDTAEKEAAVVAARERLVNKLITIAPDNIQPEDERRKWAGSVLETIQTVADGGEPPVGVDTAKGTIGTGVDAVTWVMHSLIEKGIITVPKSEPVAEALLRSPRPELLVDGPRPVILAFQAAIGMALTGKINAAIARRMKAYITELP